MDILRRNHPLWRPTTATVHRHTPNLLSTRAMAMYLQPLTRQQRVRWSNHMITPTAKSHLYRGFSPPFIMRLWTVSTITPLPLPRIFPLCLLVCPFRISHIRSRIRIIIMQSVRHRQTLVTPCLRIPKLLDHRRPATLPIRMTDTMEPRTTPLNLYPITQGLPTVMCLRRA